MRTLVASGESHLVLYEMDSVLPVSTSMGDVFFVRRWNDGLLIEKVEALESFGEEKTNPPTTVMQKRRWKRRWTA
jgi:hypothetical protein